MTDEFKEIEISKIKSLENIRTRIKDADIQELMQNIKQQGLLQPIGIWLTQKGEYIIAYGNRRFVACEKLGWKTITAKILGELTYEDLLIINTSENLHRKEITVAEFGRICHLLEQKGLSKGEISVRLGVTTQKVTLAIDNFNKIPEKHRNDIVFMRDVKKKRLGKIPASIYNNLMSINQELRLTPYDFDKLLGVIKQKELSLSQIKLVGILLKQGSSVEEALNELDNYNIRRISLPINKKVEAEMLKDNKINGQSRISRLFKAILKGEIEGRKKLVFTPKRSKKYNEKKKELSHY